MRQEKLPLILLTIQQKGSERVTQHSIILLYHTIALWVVEGGLCLLYPRKAAEFSQQCRFELCTLIRVNLPRWTQSRKDKLTQGRGHDGGRDVRYICTLLIASEAISED